LAVADNRFLSCWLRIAPEQSSMTDMPPSAWKVGHYPSGDDSCYRCYLPGINCIRPDERWPLSFWRRFLLPLLSAWY
jgi:hypothetical protein